MAISSNVGTLVAKLRIDNKPFTRGIAASQQDLRRFSGFAAGVGRNLARSFAAPLAAAGAALSAGALVQGVKDTVEHLDGIAKSASRLGLTTNALQELRFAAKASGVETQTLEMAVQRFGRRMGEALAGTGELTAGLARLKDLGLEVALRDQEGAVRSVDEAFTDFLGNIAQIEDVQTRNAIAMKAFDSEGVALVQTVTKGAASFAKLRQEARDLGVVFDKDVIASAEKMQQRLDAAATVIDVNFKRALFELAPALTSASVGISEVAASAGRLFAAMRPVTERSVSELTANLGETRKSLTGVIAEQERWQKVLEANQKVIDGGGGQFLGFEIRGLGLSDAREQAKLAQEQLEKYAETRERLEGALRRGIGGGLGGGAGGSPGGDLGPPVGGAVKNIRAQFDGILSGVQFEAAQSGLSEIQQRMATVTKQFVDFALAGAISFEEMTQGISTYATGLQAIEKNQALQQFAEQAAAAQVEAESLVASLEFEAAVTGLDPLQRRLVELQTTLATMANQGLITGEQMAAGYVRAAEAIEKIRTAGESAAESLTINLGERVAGAFRGTISGIVQGTRDAEAVLQQLKDTGIGAFEDMIASWLESKLDFDAKFEKNLGGLGDIVKQFATEAIDVFAGWTKAALQAIGQVISQIISAINLQAVLSAVSAASGGVLSLIGLAEGGVVTRATPAIVGEAGPEAVIPLDRLGQMIESGSGGGGVVVNITNTTGKPARQSQRRGGNNERIIDVMVGDSIARQAARGSAGMDGLQTFFGARRTGTRR